MRTALRIHVQGIVQGVGFRPFVYRLAKRYLISGWVLNTKEGVTIHAEGEERLVDEFVLELAQNHPAAAHVAEIDLKEVPLEDYESFTIRFSDEQATEKVTLVSPDLATCEDCVRELFDPNNRRYRYPFINCTNCGPRFTIIEELPYDRSHTSMAGFAMCEACASEYADPTDRRFHAQPDACFECGPSISYWENPATGDGAEEETEQATIWGHTREQSDAIIARCVRILLDGGILAVKGLGGFHLVCDAENDSAVATLRARKHREGKPFAVMMEDVATARKFCHVNDVEKHVLSGAQHPIVLLRKLPGTRFAQGLADHLPELGVMLPYTPLQHLLMHDFVEAGGQMLVMTSGNVHDAPIEIDDGHAREALGGIADAFLGNNRPIRARYDDSVVRVIDADGEAAIQMVRRARGYSPVPLKLSSDDAITTEYLCTGPEQKNTLCVVRGSEAFVSQHIGDLEHAETFDAWLEAKNRYQTLFQVQPEELVCDLHPEYLSTKWAHEQKMPLLQVQHHHAHIASVLGEHGIADPVCGVAFDGTGYGPDGAIWGGEILLANNKDYERFANFAYIPMPGGAACIHEPLRMAYGALWAFDLLEHPFAKKALSALGDTSAVLDQMIEHGLNTPYTSSVGRLFDAASALLGICVDPAYEGEPAILLEAAMCEAEDGADEADDDDRYTIEIQKNTATDSSTAKETSVMLFDAAGVFEALLDDAYEGVPVSRIAQRFHDAFVGAIVQGAQLMDMLYGIRTVVLSGGVFLNRYLTEHSLAALARAGFTVAVGRDLPPHDGCISFGQAVVRYNRSNRE
ncbi:MAG: carbamoyltransferase HypF [Eggerthellaceae bacterium]|nr:carbamoyltransferase HypF [Eggerthellaceae bacterium]